MGVQPLRVRKWDAQTYYQIPTIHLDLLIECLQLRRCSYLSYYGHFQSLDLTHRSTNQAAVGKLKNSCSAGTTTNRCCKDLSQTSRNNFLVLYEKFILLLKFQFSDTLRAVLFPTRHDTSRSFSPSHVQTLCEASFRSCQTTYARLTDSFRKRPKSMVCGISS